MTRTLATASAHPPSARGHPDHADACAEYEALLDRAKRLVDQVRATCDDIEGCVKDAPDDDADEMAWHLDEIQTALRSTAAACTDLAVRISKSL